MGREERTTGVADGCVSWNETESARLRRLSREYKLSSCEVDELRNLMARELSEKSLRLTAIGSCVWPVFRCEVGATPLAFIKVAPEDNVRRTLDFSREANGCRLIPVPLIDHPLRFGFRSVLCTEWRTCARLPAEEMSDSEADSFLSGIENLSQAMKNAGNVLPATGRDDPTRQYGAIAGWARRHPLFARCFAALTNLSPGEREYGTRSLTTIHGDMHMKNYGFADGRLTTVFDFDTLVKGLPCEDVAYAFTERMRKSELGREKKTRLMDLFARLVAASAWPADEWRIAVNHARLRIASRRLLKHPMNPLVAVDVERRDRELRPLLEVLS